jgi:hypothetical protein
MTICSLLIFRKSQMFSRQELASILHANINLCRTHLLSPNHLSDQTSTFHLSVVSCAQSNIVSIWVVNSYYRINRHNYYIMCVGLDLHQSNHTVSAVSRTFSSNRCCLCSYQSRHEDPTCSTYRSCGGQRCWEQGQCQPKW